MNRPISFQDSRSEPAAEAADAGLPLYADRRRWTGKRWIQTVVGLLAIQVVLMILLANRSESNLGRPNEAPLLLSLQAPDPGAESTAPLASVVSDAALLPMPSRQGFSGGGWLFDRPLQQPVMERTNAFRGLALDERYLAMEIRLLDPARRFAPVQIADKPPPPLTGENLSVPNVEVPDGSRLLIEGLAGRNLLDELQLPSWTHTDLITNTVVQVLVDDAGWVFSRSPISSSGFAKADQWALDRSRTLRFAPASSGRPTPGATPMDGAGQPGKLSLGKLIFQWHTETPQPEAGLNTAQSAAPPNSAAP